MLQIAAATEAALFDQDEGGFRPTELARVRLREQRFQIVEVLRTPPVVARQHLEREQMTDASDGHGEPGISSCAVAARTISGSIPDDAKSTSTTTPRAAGVFLLYVAEKVSPGERGGGDDVASE